MEDPKGAPMTFQILSMWSGAVLFSLETYSFKLAVEAAVKSGADLRGADLRWANLRRADLSRADLSEANLSGANLRKANLIGANLIGTNLRKANLRESDLTPIRDDLWAVLSASPSEVVGLRQAILGGNIDGSTYNGPCACLVGTLANVRHCKYDEIPGLAPRSSRPAERFFLAIKPGDTPETSQYSRLALEWVDLWLENVRSAVAERSDNERANTH
jgi:uncharacterized protein YjbI with pentapeptide repeats